MAQVIRSLLRVSYTIETPNVEPLPLYTPPLRNIDSETVSLAPSYHSEAPEYSPRIVIETPTPRVQEQEQRGLPHRQYAPGFQQPLRTGSVGDIKNHNYNVSNWSSVRTGLASKQYENVARRRVQREDSVAGLFYSLTAVPSPSASSISSSSTTGSPKPQETIPEEPPFCPQEDPELVGELAASKAKEQRLYRENCLRNPKEALKQESKGWDFMLAQMADWDEREQSWNNFRRDLNGGRRKLLARRIGFRSSI